MSLAEIPTDAATGTPVSIAPKSYPADPLPGWVKNLRPHQVTAVAQIVDAFNDGAKIVFLDAPVGSGKTLIGELVRRELSMPRALYICSDKALQDQFVRDFDYAKVLKGRANYDTMFGDRGKITAEDCTHEGGESDCMWCEPVYECPYRRAKADAEQARVAVLNTAYFLLGANKANTFAQNQLVIADEADLLEGALLGYTAFEVPAWIWSLLGLSAPVKAARRPTIVRWLRDTEFAARAFLASTRATMLDVKQTGRMRGFARECDRVAGLIEAEVDAKAEATAHLDLDDPDTEQYGGWVRDYETRTFKMLPVMVAPFGPRDLWRHGDRWLLMTGTIISPDEMAHSLGIPDDMPYATVSVPSPFPVENRPIIVAPVANVTAKATDDDKAMLIRAIERIIAKHPGRVLIHTVSYKLTRELEAAVDAGKGQDGRPRRKVTYTAGAGKASALRDYLRWPGAVMFAPSMDRGVDLAGDACECQIIVKCPFPYLGDKRVSARLRLPGGQQWYVTNTIRDVVQMTGRGVRNATDVCPTYVLDQQFARNLWAKNRRLFPASFREAVHAHTDIRWLVRDE